MDVTFIFTSRGTSITFVSVCVDVCIKKTLYLLFFWEGEGGQMSSKGSYLKRRLRSTNMLVVALLLLAWPQSELFPAAAVKSYARRQQWHVFEFFGVNVGGPSSCTGILLFLCRTFRCLSSKWNRKSKFPSFPFFFENAWFVIFHPKQVLPPPPPRFEMRYL